MGKPHCELKVGATKRCALLCNKYSNCGKNASCKLVRGATGMCTYDDAVGAGAPVKPYYEDPKNGCRSDEKAVGVPGANGTFCSPTCTSKACPSKVPDGVTAKPHCELKVGATKRCVLLCNKYSNCGKNASCKLVRGATGMCTYDDDTPFKPSMTPLKPYYEDPKSGCRKDEKVVRVPGANGTLCSPSCMSRACPTKVPDAVTGKPHCVLKVGATKRCAFLCECLDLHGSGSPRLCKCQEQPHRHVESLGG